MVSRVQTSNRYSERYYQGNSLRGIDKKTISICLLMFSSLTHYTTKLWIVVQSNLAIRNGLIRNKLVLRNHFLGPICHLLHKDKELLALRNNFKATKKCLIANFDCIWKIQIIENWKMQPGRSMLSWDPANNRINS